MYNEVIYIYQTLLSKATYIHTLMVAAMQSAAWDSVSCPRTLSLFTGESNQQPSSNKTLALPLSHNTWGGQKFLRTGFSLPVFCPPQSPLSLRTDSSCGHPNLTGRRCAACCAAGLYPRHPLLLFLTEQHVCCFLPKLTDGFASVSVGGPTIRHVT